MNTWLAEAPLHCMVIQRGFGCEAPLQQCTLHSVSLTTALKQQTLTDDIQHGALCCFNIVHSHVIDCSVQCEIGTRTRETSALPTQAQFLVPCTAQVTETHPLINSPRVSSVARCSTKSTCITTQQQHFKQSQISFVNASRHETGSLRCFSTLQIPSSVFNWFS